MPVGPAFAARVGSSRKRDMTRQKGLTLIELLVTVAILGVSFVVIVGGLSTAILGSDVHHRQVIADAIVRTAADEVRAADYVDCAPADEYDDEIAAPTGYDSEVTVVGYLVGDDFKKLVDSACAPPTPPTNADEGLQLVKITVTAEERSVSESVTIAKRRP